jgi:Glycosyl hydrolase family 12
MNKLSERALLGGIAGGLVLAVAAGCSSTSAPGTSAAAGAPAVGTAGSGVVGGAGASGFGTVASGGGASGFGTVSGGASGVAGAGIVSGGAGGVSTGTAGTAGTGGAPLACNSADTNLVNGAGCYVGCDPTLTTDNPQGIQGAFYGYGDGVTCSAAPPPPCTAAGACMMGATVATATDWGCGMGLELNSTGGTTPVKQLYTGAASCFSYTLTGSSGGNDVRVSFTQSADTAGQVSPFVNLPAFTNGKTGTVCFKDASCNGLKPCTPPSATAPSGYDIQFQVVGGTKAGAFNICLTNLTPATNGGTTFSQVCGVQGALNATADVGKYFVQNNLFPGNASNKLCVTPKATTSGAGFTVDSATFATGATLNAYPSVVDGWHYGRMSSDTALPKQMNSVVSVNSSVSYTGSDNNYDAAYDIWVLPNKPTTATTMPTGGLEVMIWLNSASVSPAGGSPVGQYMGWDVFVTTVQGWDYVAYRKNGQSTFTADLKPFITDAISRSNKLKNTNPWLSGIEFGFELYDYPGTGFAVTNFSSDVK